MKPADFRDYMLRDLCYLQGFADAMPDLQRQLLNKKLESIRKTLAEFLKKPTNEESEKLAL